LAQITSDKILAHFSYHPTYIHPEDWRGVDELIDWIIEKNKAGYQMVLGAAAAGVSFCHHETCQTPTCF
jgi:hypothetical protein